MLKKLLIIGFVLLVAVVLVCNFYLGTAITSVINSQGPSALKTGVSVEAIAINVLGGKLDIHKFLIDNVSGFESKNLFKLDRAYAQISIPKLLSKQVIIDNILVKDAETVIERSKDGKINLQELLNRIAPQGKEPAAAQPKEKTPAQPSPAKSAAPMPPAMLKSLDISTALDFIDYTLSTGVFKVGFELRVKAENIATFGNPDEMTGIVSIMGNLKGKPDLFAVKADLKIAPLIDPLKPTFDLTATISNVDMSVFEPYSNLTKVKKGKMEISSRIVCKKGAFDKKYSVQRITIKELTLDPSATQNVPPDMLPKELSFECGVGGTIEKPEVDFMQILNKIIMDQLLNPANLLKNPQISQMLGKDGKAVQSMLTGGKDGQKPDLQNLTNSLLGGNKTAAPAAAAPAAGKTAGSTTGAIDMMLPQSSGTTPPSANAPAASNGLSRTVKTPTLGSPGVMDTMEPQNPQASAKPATQQTSSVASGLGSLVGGKKKLGF